MFRLLFVPGILVCTLAAGLAVQDQDKEEKQDKQDDTVVIPDDGNAIARRDFMRTKLMYSQNIFEGLTTGNFRLIQDGIKEIKGVTEAEKWIAVDDDRYRKLTQDFKTAIKRLEAAAKTNNIDATAMRYYQMSTSCIDCHKHIRVAQYEY